MVDIWSTLGTQSEGARLERLQRSPNYAGGRFVNALPQHEGEMLPVLKKWLFQSNAFREPSEPLPVVHRVAEDFAVSSSTDSVVLPFR